MRFHRSCEREHATGSACKHQVDATRWTNAQGTQCGGEEKGQRTGEGREHQQARYG